MNKSFEVNLSKGNVAVQLIRFSIPLLLSNFIQSCYSVADMIIVGQFAGTVAMSGVNIGGQLTFLITNMVFGLCAGATVLIGQYIGSNNREALKKTVSTLFTLLLILSGVATVVMVALRGPILTLIKTPAESFEEAKSYLFYTSLGTVFILGYNAFSAVMRGMGDSRRPLIFVAIACVTNIALDLLMVGVLKMGASGAAIATVISQALSMILCMFYFERSDFVFKFRFSSLKIDREAASMILKIGGPMSVQNTVTSISFLFLTAMVNSISYIASAAVGAVGKINGFAILPAVAMSNSISAIAAHNIGAGEYDRAVKTFRIGAAIAYAFSIAVFVLVTLFPAFFLRLFNDDSALIDAGVQYMRTFSFDYLCVPMMFTLNGLFIGAGHTTFSLINNMLSAVLIRVPVSYLFGIVMEMGLFGVGLGAPFATIISIICAIIYYASGRWKKATIIR